MQAARAKPDLPGKTHMLLVGAAISTRAGSELLRKSGKNKQGRRQMEGPEVKVERQMKAERGKEFTS